MKPSQVRIVIQSRLSSSRLPGKAMLSIRGYPSVVLCALRAANSGLSVMVATSEGPEDAAIAETVMDAGIAVHRGSLDDVLSRYVSATEDMDDDDYVVRFTADNMFPDGNLVTELINSVGEPTSGSDYVAFGHGYPYGMWAGAVRVKWLRKAHAETTAAYDREHVMPWVSRHQTPTTFPWPGQKEFGDCSRLRSTLDSLSDYLRVRQAFEDAGGDPVHVSWRELIRSLRDQRDAPKLSNPIRWVHGARIGALQLGTAQLGMPYGVANETGQPSDVEAKSILDAAMAHGIEVIDTARQYGNAETRIGNLVHPGDASRFRVNTKLSGLYQLSPNAGPREVRSAVEASVLKSCRELRLQSLPVVMLHRTEHLTWWGGAAWDRLVQLQKEGVIRDLGLSIYRPEELAHVAERPLLKHLQLPFNLLDRRWLETSIQAQIHELIAENKVWVTARSVLLQGLLRLPASQWPQFEGVAPEEIIRTLEQLVRDFERKNIVDLCLAYVRAQSWVHSVVMGVDSKEQLLANLGHINQKPLSREECETLETRLPAGPINLVNPALWKRGALVSSANKRVCA